VQNTIVIKKAINGDIISGGNLGLFVTNKEFNHWTLLHEGSYSDFVLHGNMFTALDYVQCKVVRFKMFNDKGQYEWKLQSSFDISAEHRGLWENESNATLIVDKDNNVIVCNENTLLVYSDKGDYIKTITLFEDDYVINGMDSKGNVILCDYWTGKLYSINNILQFDCNNMEQYLVFDSKKCTRDQTIDCDGNLWILHGDKHQYYLTKYFPLYLCI
jgi:hypothetical protein